MEVPRGCPRVEGDRRHRRMAAEHHREHREGWRQCSVVPFRAAGRAKAHGEVRPPEAGKASLDSPVPPSWVPHREEDHGLGVGQVPDAGLGRVPDLPQTIGERRAYAGNEHRRGREDGDTDERQAAVDGGGVGTGGCACSVVISPSR